MNVTLPAPCLGRETPPRTARWTSTPWRRSIQALPNRPSPWCERLRAFGAGCQRPSIGACAAAGDSHPRQRSDPEDRQGAAWALLVAGAPGWLQGRPSHDGARFTRSDPPRWARSPSLDPARWAGRRSPTCRDGARALLPSELPLRQVRPRHGLALGVWVASLLADPRVQRLDSGSSIRLISDAPKRVVPFPRTRSAV